MFKVVRPFADAYDREHIYNIGDTFPRAGVEVSIERLEELSSDRNRCGAVFIVEEGLSEVKEDTGESKAGVGPSGTVKTKGRPRKGQKKDA